MMILLSVFINDGILKGLNLSSVVVLKTILKGGFIRANPDQDFEPEYFPSEFVLIRKSILHFGFKVHSRTS